MQKTLKKRNLNVKASHSRLMLRNLFESLVTYGKVETTGRRARILRAYADEKLCYFLNAKEEKINNDFIKRLGSDRSAEKTLKFVAFLKKQGKNMRSGFTTVVRTKYRAGDNSLMLEVKLLGFEDFLKEQKPVKKVGSVAKKVAKKEVKKTTVAKKTKRTVSDAKSKVPEMKENEKGRDENFFSKLGERFLGRKSKGPVIERKGRASSRSGI